MGVNHSSDDLPVALHTSTRTTINQAPIYTHLNYHRLSPSYQAFIISLSTVNVPKIVTEALLHPGLHHVMIEEMTALHDFSTWELVSLLKGKTIVGYHWVFKVKVGSDGAIDCLKVRHSC